MRNGILCLILLSVIFEISPGQSLTWSAEQSITMNAPGTTTRPRLIALGNERGILIWGHEQDQSIHYAIWENEILSTPRILDIGPRKAFITSWASTEIAGKDNLVYVVFKEDPAETGKIYLMRSMDYGETFTPAIPVVDPNGFYCRFPGVAIDADLQPIVSYMRFQTDWSQPEYVSIRSEDFGNTFDPYTQVTDKNKGEACDCCPVAMETDENRIAVFYRNNRNNIRNMTAAVSFNNGKSYDIVTELDTANWNLLSCPSTGGDGFFADSFLHTTWISGRTGTAKAYYSRLNLNTQKVDGFYALTHNQGRNFQQTYPRMAGYNDTVGIVWGELINSMDVLFTHFTNGNYNDLSLNTQRINTGINGNQGSPDVAFANSRFYVCWQDLNDYSIKFKIGKYKTTNTLTSVHKNEDIRITPVTEGYIIQSVRFMKKVTLYNLSGQQILQKENTTEVHFDRLPVGMYHLVVLHENGVFTYPLVRI